MKQIILILFLCAINLFGQSALEYFPHKKNDYWVYDYHDYYFHYTLREYISKDSISSNGFIYITTKSRLFDVMTKWYTENYLIDTLNQVWLIQNTNLTLKFKLNAKLGEQWIVDKSNNDYFLVRVTSIKEYTIFRGWNRIT